MDHTVEIFEDFRALLKDQLELFAYPVDELINRYGQGYKDNTVFILQKLEDFARRHHHTLYDTLLLYADHIKQTADAYKLFGQTGKYEYTFEDEIKHIVEDNAYQLHYTYVLALSTVLNRGRYELFLHYRQMVKKYLKANHSVLEIGAGNCLDSMFTSGYGQVDAYERNDMSLEWQEILDLNDKIKLRIENYEFDGAKKYDFITMIELLEHVSDPTVYLNGAHAVLNPAGKAYLTFAVRMPQVDHLYQIDTIEQCKKLVSDCKFKILEDYCTILNHMPFDEDRRWVLAEDPKYAVTYCCVVEKTPEREVDRIIRDFNVDL
jgi:2-polyprenyl-3-methyl-5-hydroxy-6-metoxy-1,4-benzoquinol methylase